MVWAEWVEWECNLLHSFKNSKRAVFTALFFWMLYISLVDIVFCRQIGYLNFFIRGIKIKVLKTIFKNNFTFTTVTKSKYKIYKWDPSGSEVYLTQCFTDWGNEYIFLDSIKNRDPGILLDVGCHTGYFPCLFKNFFNRIIGFEPNSKSFSVLKNVNMENFEYYQNFVSDETKEVIAIDTEDGWSFQSEVSRDIVKKKINQITLDKFSEDKNLKNITGIKIDVDGIDLKVLNGCKNIIKENRPSILIENYSNKLIKFFENLDYVLLSLVSSKDKSYNLELEELKNFDQNKWIKMVCCIPREFEKNYTNYIFKGNFLTGINKKEIKESFLNI